MAFNAKNLTYDKSEPAFLQRLKAGYAAQDGRNNVQFARPSKSRLNMGDDDEDNGPVILDESGEVVEKNVYEGMLKGDNDDVKAKGEKGREAEVNSNAKEDRNEAGEEDERKDEREKQKVAEVGTTKKRKAIKVIGNDEVTDGKKEDIRSKEPKFVSNAKSRAEKTAPSDKPKKKSKKIKLSFDEPE